jgi:hypothetical protein
MNNQTDESHLEVRVSRINDAKNLELGVHSSVGALDVDLSLILTVPTENRKKGQALRAIAIDIRRAGEFVLNNN